MCRRCVLMQVVYARVSDVRSRGRGACRRRVACVWAAHAGGVRAGGSRDVCANGVRVRRVGVRAGGVAASPDLSSSRGAAWSGLCAFFVCFESPQHLASSMPGTGCQWGCWS